ncbi:MAG: heavy metal-associated domain-containing protein [Eubacteriales bacterium]|nr:heavy metal-associated domain-containing protein [Eubacteriales bacterium]
MGTYIILAIIAVIAFFGVRSSLKHVKGEGGCCGGGGGSIDEESVRLEHPVVERKTLIIDGMHCDHCKNAVMRQLQRVDGVSARVNLKKKTALVEMDREVPDEELIMAVERAGYSVSDIKKM